MEKKCLQCGGNDFEECLDGLKCSACDSLLSLMDSSPISDSLSSASTKMLEGDFTESSLEIEKIVEDVSARPDEIGNSSAEETINQNNLEESVEEILGSANASIEFKFMPGSLEERYRDIVETFSLINLAKSMMIDIAKIAVEEGDDFILLTSMDKYKSVCDIVDREREAAKERYEIEKERLDSDVLRNIADIRYEQLMDFSVTELSGGIDAFDELETDVSVENESLNQQVMFSTNADGEQFLDVIDPNTLALQYFVRGMILEVLFTLKVNSLKNSSVLTDQVKLEVILELYKYKRELIEVALQQNEEIYSLHIRVPVILEVPEEPATEVIIESDDAVVLENIERKVRYKSRVVGSLNEMKVKSNYKRAIFNFSIPSLIISAIIMIALGVGSYFLLLNVDFYAPLELAVALSVLLGIILIVMFRVLNSWWFTKKAKTANAEYKELYKVAYGVAVDEAIATDEMNDINKLAIMKYNIVSPALMAAATIHNSKVEELIKYFNSSCASLTFDSGMNDVIKELDVVGEDMFSEYHITAIYNMIRSKRAKSITEAVNIHIQQEQDNAHKNEILSRQQAESDRQRRHDEDMASSQRQSQQLVERQAIAQRQAAEAAALAQERAASAAESAARSAQSTADSADRARREQASHQAAVERKLNNY